ncbi:tryptophan synthase subunit beta like protein [Salinispirillum sp. LH 10-3-1]|uniref:Tryptophan synthase subunit beta like protein n=1 Tax=Salinispirillum sp. LH 10-3-1 TaxID=2952525 RepID=A0AB38YIY6_9GAMM
MYVQRNTEGDIIAVSREQTADVAESVEDNSAELRAFLSNDDAVANNQLAQSDQDMARVLEDVVNLLIDRSVIRFTDLPLPAQQKLMNRRALRDQMNSVDLLGDDDDLKI